MTSKLKTWLPIAVFALLWLDLWRQLSYEWRINEQYALAVCILLQLKWP